MNALLDMRKVITKKTERSQYRTQFNPTHNHKQPACISRFFLSLNIAYFWPDKSQYFNIITHNKWN